MNIFIKDIKKCEDCKRRTCMITESTQIPNSFNLKPEKFTCPVKIFENGFLERQIELEQINVELKESDKECILCLLCAANCSQNNLQVDKISMNIKDMFETNGNNEQQSNILSNTIALAYMQKIFTFAANTNFSRAITFDGFAISDDESFFVEVDINNDALESCRRILGEMTMFNCGKDNKILNGIIVLETMPKDNSNVNTLIRKIREFPTTQHVKIYMTTMSLLRYWAMTLSEKQSIKNMLYDCASESIDSYINKLLSNGFISDDIAQSI